jgi:hypothetical protein
MLRVDKKQLGRATAAGQVAGDRPPYGFGEAGAFASVLN